MDRAYYSASITKFLEDSPEQIVGSLTKRSIYPVEPAQVTAWLGQIQILKAALTPHSGTIYFEYDIPRMGSRADNILVIGTVVFVIEFKVGEEEFPNQATNQVWDYALDLKHFHKTSHNANIVPILVSTRGKKSKFSRGQPAGPYQVERPLKTDADGLSEAITLVLESTKGQTLNSQEWNDGKYHPSPTIIEAATALYARHTVENIASNEAGENLEITSKEVSRIIDEARTLKRKTLCFVTGVPGAGKTLVGLDVANRHRDVESETYSVFLSGNGPLVNILIEALASDRVSRSKLEKKPIRKGDAEREVEMFIQNVHHFRDEYLRDPGAPAEHVALFDEAQRAWDLKQTANFMLRKKRTPGFSQSEPEFLLSCMDRHKDWAVVVCLVGGGQEINTGEAGISEWIKPLNGAFKNWHVYLSPNLTDSEYAAGNALSLLNERPYVHKNPSLHLDVSMRSFRTAHVSSFVKHLLDLDRDAAKKSLGALESKFPIVLTRDLQTAKRWLRSCAQGSQRIGIVASSQAERLRPHAIDVRSATNPVHWFLKPSNHIRSSYYLEEVATQFDVQGLELDWTCISWDGDFRYSSEGWGHHTFSGDRWNVVRSEDRKRFLKNAYRVLLTRARQGMIIFVPHGDPDDITRASQFYDPTFEYLKSIGLPVV